jgi:hypothetical protein
MHPRFTIDDSPGTALAAKTGVRGPLNRKRVLQNQPISNKP